MDRQAALRTLHQMYGLTEDSSFTSTELKVAEMLEVAGARGLRVDSEVLASETDKLQVSLASLQEEINLLATRSVKVGSAVDLAKLFFEELGLPQIKLTKSGKPSFCNETLKKYNHPIAQLISTWKSTRSTTSFLRAMETFVVEGRVHTT